MWLLTPVGFFSAVADRAHPGQVVVRARHRDDAEALIQAVAALRGDAAGHEPELIAFTVSDYPWRVILPRADWSEFLLLQAEAITYTNFKDEVTRRQGQERHDVYSRVWGVLLGLERLPGALRGKRRLERSRYAGLEELLPAKRVAQEEGLLDSHRRWWRDSAPVSTDAGAELCVQLAVDVV